jgi:hypothetical protein
MITLSDLHHVYAAGDADVLRRDDPRNRIVVPTQEATADTYLRRLLNHVEAEARRRGIDLTDPFTGAAVTVAATQMLLASLDLLSDDDGDQDAPLAAWTQ